MSRNVGQFYDVFDQISAGTSTQATYRHRIHIFGAESGLAVQFVFANYKSCPDSITSLSTITVAAAVEISGVVTPLTFSGSAEVSIAAGSTATSDAITLTTNDFIYVRTRPKVSTMGNKWPLGYIYGGASFGNEGLTDATDLTLTGSAAVGVAVGYGYGPYQIIASVNQYASVFVEGDSIAYGQGDDGTTGYTAEAYLSDKGWVSRVLNHTRPTKHNAKSGTTASQHATNTYTNAQYGMHTYMLCELGVNDLSDTLANIKANLSSIYSGAKAAGLRVAQSTITPDGNAGHEATRTALNAWIRAKTDTNLDYVIEVADAVETTRDSGTWITGYTGDNLHPTTTGHIAIASAVGTALLNDIHAADNIGASRTRMFLGMNIGI
jgi:lysophospholipase L1-like esterase